jgi:putative addiction module component (TIGR02574 family)
MNVADDLFAQALTLPVEQRVELAERLFGSLPAQEDTLPVVADDELTLELERRSALRESGQSGSRSLDEAMIELRSAVEGTSVDEHPNR